MQTTPAALQLLPGALVNLYVNDLPKRGRAQRAPLLCVIPARHSTGSETGQERGDCAEVLGSAANGHRIPLHQDRTERAEQPELSSAAHTGGGRSEHKGGPWSVFPPPSATAKHLPFLPCPCKLSGKRTGEGQVSRMQPRSSSPSTFPPKPSIEQGWKSGEIPPKLCDLASGPDPHHCCDPVM